MNETDFIERVSEEKNISKNSVNEQAFYCIEPVDEYDDFSQKYDEWVESQFNNFFNEQSELKKILINICEVNKKWKTKI